MGRRVSGLGKLGLPKPAAAGRLRCQRKPNAEGLPLPAQDSRRLQILSCGTPTRSDPYLTPPCPAIVDPGASLAAGRFWEAVMLGLVQAIEIPVGFSAVGHLDHQDHQTLLLDAVENPVVPALHPPEVAGVDQKLSLGRPRIVGQGLYHWPQGLPDRGRQLGQLPASGRREFDLVGHERLEAQFLLDLFPWDGGAAVPLPLRQGL